MQRIVDSREALAVALREARARGPGQRFVVQLPGLSRRDNLAVAQRLERLAAACGCGEAAAASLACSAAYLGWVLARGLEASGGALVVTGVASAVFLLAGAGGKVLGIARHRRRAQRLIAPLLVR